MKSAQWIVVFAVWGALGTGVGAFATPTVALTQSTRPATVDGEIRFDLIVTNDSTTAENYTLPNELACRLTTPDGVADVTAQRVDVATTAAAEQSIAPGAFLRATYVAKLLTSGRVIVELRDQPGATVVNVVPVGAAVKPHEAATLPAARTNNPLSIITAQDPNYQRESGLVEFLSYRVKAHEPVYILAGNEDPSTKFQFSFKYQVFNPVGGLAQKMPALGGVYFAYSQTSFWDLGDEENSNPFYDSSYRPELMLSYDNLDRFFRDDKGNRFLPDGLTFNFQAGLKHESNGRSEPDSRSVNIVYIRPIIRMENSDGWFVAVAPTFWTYVFDLSDNPDIEDYRGHGELRLVAGRAGGLQLAATGRIGESGHGSVMVDVTYPIRALTFGNFDAYLDVQYFNGYGESILNYNQSEETLRFGISLVR